MPPAIKILLIILGIIAAFVAVLVLLLLLLRIKIKIGYRDMFSFKLYVGGIRVASLPRPPKKLRRLRTYTKKKAARAAAKYARRPEDYLEMVRQNALYRALMQKRAEKKAQKKKAPAKAAAPKPKQPEDKLNIEILLQMIAEIIDAFFEGTRKGLHIHVCRLHVFVVGKDAAETALICGGLWAALSNLLAVLDAHARLRVSKADVSIVPDYTGEKTRTDFSLIISFGIVRTLHTLLSLLPIILKHKDSLFTKANPTQPTKQKQ